MAIAKAKMNAAYNEIADASDFDGVLEGPGVGLPPAVIAGNDWPETVSIEEESKRVVTTTFEVAA